MSHSHSHPPPPPLRICNVRNSIFWLFIILEDFRLHFIMPLPLTLPLLCEFISSLLGIISLCVCVWVCVSEYRWSYQIGNTGVCHCMLLNPTEPAFRFCLNRNGICLTRFCFINICGWKGEECVRISTSKCIWNQVIWKKKIWKNVRSIRQILIFFKTDLVVIT